jgi:A repeated domain in UCH-protein
LFAYDRQVQTDPGNAAYYFECLQDLAIGRESAVLEEKVQILASEGQTNRKEVAKAYRYFGINPVHSAQLTDEIIVGQFRARLQDTSPASEDETRNMLRIIGQARQSSKILQEASNGERSILFGDMQQLTPLQLLRHTLKLFHGLISVQKRRTNLYKQCLRLRCVHA